MLLACWLHVGCMCLQVRRLQGEEHAVREENEQLLRKNEDLEEAVKKLGEAHAETQSYLKQIKDQMSQYMYYVITTAAL